MVQQTEVMSRLYIFNLTAMHSVEASSGKVK